jgi:Domain of unknown function (DUF4265)
MGKISVLTFVLNVEDSWPPVAIESIPCTQTDVGYRIENPPLFVKNISVGDVISVSRDAHGDVVAWRHISESLRTTIWLLRKHKTAQIDGALTALRALNCHTVQLKEYGCFSIDIPAEISIDKVDSALSTLDASDVAIAYPSYRHAQA